MEGAATTAVPRRPGPVYTLQTAAPLTSPFTSISSIDLTFVNQFNQLEHRRIEVLLAVIYMNHYAYNANSREQYSQSTRTAFDKYHKGSEEQVKSNGLLQLHALQNVGKRIRPVRVGNILQRLLSKLHNLRMKVGSRKRSRKIQSRGHSRRGPNLAIDDKPGVGDPFNLVELLVVGALRDGLQRVFVGGRVDPVEEPSLREEQPARADREEAFEVGVLVLDPAGGFSRELEEGVGSWDEEVVELGSGREVLGRRQRRPGGRLDGLQVAGGGDVVPVDNGRLLDERLGEVGESCSTSHERLSVAVDIVNRASNVEPLVGMREEDTKLDGGGRVDQGHLGWMLAIGWVALAWVSETLGLSPARFYSPLASSERG